MNAAEIAGVERELAEQALRGYLITQPDYVTADGAVEAMAPHLDRLVELAAAALARLGAVERLSACYRVETRPTEKLLAELEDTRRRLDVAVHR